MYVFGFLLQILLLHLRFQQKCQVLLSNKKVDRDHRDLFQVKDSIYQQFCNLTFPVIIPKIYSRFIKSTFLVAMESRDFVTGNKITTYVKSSVLIPYLKSVICPERQDFKLQAIHSLMRNLLIGEHAVPLQHFISCANVCILPSSTSFAFLSAGMLQQVWSCLSRSVS